MKEDTRRLLILSYTDLQILKGYQEYKFTQNKTILVGIEYLISD